MKQYLDLASYVLANGKKRKNRTDTDTLSVFGYQMKFDLTNSFPLLTTKKVNWKAIVHELLWFIKGDTNIKYLVDNGVNIWNEWPYENFKKSPSFQNETLQEFILKVKTDNEFAKQFADLGPVYGKQWRNFNGVDQLKKVIQEIKENPNSRRLIVSSWNPSELEKMALAPCHSLFQFYVEEDKLSLQLYQRSGDIFLGVPFNIASYALLVYLVAHETKLKPGYFIHTLGDAHIYENHIEQIKLQLTRTTLDPPQVVLKSDKSIFAYSFDDIELVGYNYHPFIYGRVAV
ncbi:thymidylate synthase [Mycoplasmoides genitalium]|uniref:Thymidylate synthase n=2 Tax=Mycoplasmoides genitalium TaxID=2097 RepID=TYSY_MYCGE|nr:thymidylate synthase [Mycoplasmoides genitalium]P47469.1 RecName: Full=Thymidylate synthase; Short=TS; Short=TSase [Mycoplasmoides genitalium G37]ABY79533.1 thymidylate synthase [synthetic Mycoplasma genitalium JCVI-1.0]AAC71448.1 thymidylate synthase [Mycoplasmoides genitalium G37]AFQ03058.1 thymidylate synthase [Mycoplasmoides genitalium M2321]AFQ03547.1 thymidylate synthase [Mycoplasmoides genitalium M6282]AFQ04049.1 thymidylate synthase [Mycoplasmoides genitalium M6320]